MHPRFPFSVLTSFFLIFLFVQCQIRHQETQRANARTNLGRHLFFDTRLSATGTKSCSSCHDPNFAFSDGYRRSSGIYADPTLRNAPSLINAVYMPSLNWANPDITQFRQQALRPLFNDDPPEMGLYLTDPAFRQKHIPANIHDQQGLPVDSVFQRLQSDTLYSRLMKQAFPTVQHPWSIQYITAALESFEKTLVSFNSPYDAYLNGDKTAISESAQRGMALFFGEKLRCGTCHSGKTLSDGQFYNIGLYDLEQDGSYPAEDQGLFNITGKTSDKGRFRTPTLRNIAVTGPYFHDGSTDLLTEVIHIFEQGGREAGKKNPHKSPLIRPFSLSQQEKRDLIAFLESLTDTTISQNPRLQNPFAE